MPRPKKSTVSAAYTLVNHCWESNSRHDRSRLRRNQALRQAVALAILGGMKFAPDDFRRFHEEFRGGHWFGADGGECFYSAAVKYNHLSACQSFESFKSRKPFLRDTGARVAVGSTLEWDGRQVKLTSFTTDKDEDVAILCAHEAEGQVLAKRYRVGLTEWQGEMKRRKAARTPPERWSLVTDSTGEDWIVTSTSTRDEGSLDLETVAVSPYDSRYPKDTCNLSYSTFLRAGWKVKAPPPKDVSGARASARYVSIGVPLRLEELVSLARQQGLRIISAYRPGARDYTELALYGRPAQMLATDAAWLAAAKKKRKGRKPQRNDFLSKKPKAAFGVNLHLPRESWVDKDESPPESSAQKKSAAKKARATK